MTDTPNGTTPYAVKYDLTNCDKEPIHLIRLVQPHACLLVCTLPDFKIIQLSDNSPTILGLPIKRIQGISCRQILDRNTMDLLEKGITATEGFKDLNPMRVLFAQRANDPFMNVIAHINPDGLLILEIEPISNNISTSAYQHLISKSIQRVQTAPKGELFQVVADEIKEITNYDRVMIYQFDEQYNGSVIAEIKEPHLEPYLHLKYPATDIPEQARALFLKNKVRLVADVTAVNSYVVPIRTPETEKPLDVTYSATRGVSPIHIEYLKNMGVGATMSVAISIDNKLWGLIACHHSSPKYLDHTIRSTCAFIGQIFSGHLALQSAIDFRQSIIKSNFIRNSLFEQMGKDFNMMDGLTQKAKTIMDLVDCSGAAVITDNQIKLLGKTPTKGQIVDLLDWLVQQTGSDVYTTDKLPELYKPALQYKETATGVMCIKFEAEPSEFILWFRPEQPQEVFWGGNPNKAIAVKEAGVRISPRKSFAKWKQVVENTSRPWDGYEKEAATALRNDIKEFIIQKFHEIRKLNNETLKAYEELESFSYSVSHDLRAPLRTIEGYTQILKEDYLEQFDEFGLEILNTIVESVQKMNSFINDILRFSKLGKSELILNELDVEEIISNAFKDLVNLEDKERNVVLNIPERLPVVWGDQSLMNQLVNNLISNAIKYTRNQAKAIITVTGEQKADYSIISFEDNGIGFDMQYVDKVFGVFSRLVGENEYEGTGVGLAIVKRVIERHDGKVSVHSELEKGTIFTLKFPVKRAEV